MSQTIEFWMKQTEIRESALKIAESRIVELKRIKDQLLIAANAWEDRFKIAESQLDAVRKVQRYEVEPDMMEGNPPVCWTPDDDGEGIKFDELQAALNGEGK